ncbi:hypothetical protein X798_00869 [Onchocerca flexuosa]|uniref:Uncharacterized protein n=2 Tax=Onchocerca flexuosa TaxID=387005 RepID=A0A183I3Y9_9BILA|nr:hypothetical protein X798_00869 [Onchocerca flexuosa]VDP17101.1 unnamed protein product [Onchocerca flexuosa]
MVGPHAAVDRRMPMRFANIRGLVWRRDSSGTKAFLRSSAVSHFPSSIIPYPTPLCCHKERPVEQTAKIVSICHFVGVSFCTLAYSLKRLRMILEYLNT